MPTTLTGLILFVVLLLPGFAYLVGKERNGTERRVSPFRETVSIVSASVTSELGAAAVTAIVWVPALDVRHALPDTDQWWRAHAWAIVAWSALILLVATLAAWLATTATVRRYWPGEYPHSSTVSGWWKLFKRWAPPGSTVMVQCRLEDGSFITGMLGSFNPNADDIEDREIAMWAPLHFRPKGSSRSEELDLDVMTISARRIRWLGVKYFNPQGLVTREGVLRNGRRRLADLLTPRRSRRASSAASAAQHGSGPASCPVSGPSAPQERPPSSRPD